MHVQVLLSEWHIAIYRKTKQNIIKPKIIKKTMQIKQLKNINKTQNKQKKKTNKRTNNQDKNNTK